MNKKKILSRAEKFAKNILEKDTTGHDWWHIVRVINNARLINKKEKADDFIIELAVLLHDVGDRKVINKDMDDYSIAEKFLTDNNVTKEVFDEVMFIIKNMSFSKTLNNKKHGFSKEYYVVQDADRLDAIGAIGIARMFTYGGSKSRPLYNPEKIVKEVKTTKSYIKQNNSTFHHFEEKLLHLKNLMNTQTAKKIAGKRDLFMRQYIQQFLDEWSGIK